MSSSPNRKGKKTPTRKGSENNGTTTTPIKAEVAEAPQSSTTITPLKPSASSKRVSISVTASDDIAVPVPAGKLAAAAAAGVTFVPLSPPRGSSAPATTIAGSPSRTLLGEPPLQSPTAAAATHRMLSRSPPHSGLRSPGHVPSLPPTPLAFSAASFAPYQHHTAAGGRRSPAHISNSVAASVVRNALPQKSSGSGIGAYAPPGGSAGSGPLSGYHQQHQLHLRATPINYHGSSADEGSTSAGHLPFAAAAAAAAADNESLAGSSDPGAGDGPMLDFYPVSPEVAMFSRERALENFKKAKDEVMEHMKRRADKGKDLQQQQLQQQGDAASGALVDDHGNSAGSAAGQSVYSGVSGTGDGGAHAAAHAAALEAEDDDEGNGIGGGQLYSVIKAAMLAADGIDGDDNDYDDDDYDDDNATVPRAADDKKTTRTVNDWCDDDDEVLAPSAFFRSPASLEATSNRVMEAIIKRGHAASTDAELRWFYRHSYLLNLLSKEDLDDVVAASLRREYTNGEAIATEKHTLKHLYTVVWGDVEVFQPTSLDLEKRALESAFKVTANRGAERRQRQVNSLSSLGSFAGKPGNNGLGPRNAVSSATSSPHNILDLRRKSVGGGGSAHHNTSNADDEAAAAHGSGDDTIYTHMATLLPGQVFGTESFVFDQKNTFVFRAGASTKKTIVSLIPFDVLATVLARNPRFAQGVGSAITSSVDVFGPIRQFCRYVFSPQMSQNDYLPLWSIVDAYTKIDNVIHTKLFSTELDTGAWGYALGRLPENVTSTFCFDLVHALPPFVASRMRREAYAADVSKPAPNRMTQQSRARTALAYIKTKERRRCTWHLGMDGKDLVLLRDGFTDLLDFLTMLCVHIVESNKLRGRVQGMVHPPAIDLLDEYLRQREEEIENQITIAPERESARIKGVLACMPLTADEQAGLLRNWGSDTLLKIYEVMMHREEFNIRVDPSISRKFQFNPFHEWALNLRSCILAKLGLDRSSPLPDDVFIDVVSSNTHCIKNLLCSFNRRHQAEILAYAIRKEGKKLGKPEEWHTLADMLYAATPGFLKDERPDLKEEFQRSLEDNGITVLHDTAMTGLQVDVIPVHQLNFDTIDETIRASLKATFERRVAEGRLSREASVIVAAAAGTAAPTWDELCHPMAAVATPVEREAAPHNSGSFSDSTPDLATAAAVMSACSPTGTAAGDSTHAHSNSQSQSPAPEGTAATATPTTSHDSKYRLSRHFIINMDFAFGAQAEGICRTIFSAFGHRVRSVSVMGKAGGMQGKRGDIMLASHVLLSKSSLILEDNQDELRSCRNQDLTQQRLQALVGPKCTVHHGKVLTVTGTILQNAALLRYYRNVWRCVGTEMEGSYFARVIEDFYRQGIARPNLTTRFGYYTSDLPLAQSDAEMEARSGKKHGGGASATLSAPMTPQEGVPPLYAIARGILENILFSSEMEKMAVRP